MVPPMHFLPSFGPGTLLVTLEDIAYSGHRTVVASTIQNGIVSLHIAFVRHHNNYQSMELKMEEIEVRWIHAIQVWWSWLWRTIVIAFPLSCLLVMLFDMLVEELNPDIQEYVFIPQMASLCLWIYFPVSVLKKILSKSFNGYRIALIKVDTSAYSGHPQF